MKFTKMHGCGNDYIYVDLFTEKVKNQSDAAIKLSDRHFGVGGDGVIYIQKGTKADFEMVCIMQTALAAQCAETVFAVLQDMFTIRDIRIKPHSQSNPWAR